MSDKSFKNYLDTHGGPTFNLLLSWGLFFGLAIPAVAKYGYSNEIESRDENFGIASGPAGSGVFPLMTLLFIVATCQWFFYLYFYYAAAAKVDNE